MVLLLVFSHRLDHESHVLLDKSFIVGWQSLLTPTEFYKALSFILSDRLHELPEHLDQRCIWAVVGVVSTVSNVSL